MLENLTLAVFSKQLNTRFRVSVAPSGSVDIVLTQATDMGSTPRQEQFAVQFRGPQETFLQQGTYRLEHDQMGPFDLFLVPVGRDPNGYSYEAIFNRLVP